MGIFSPAFHSAAAGTQSVSPLSPSAASLAGAAAAHVAAVALLAVLVPAERVAEFVRPLAVRMVELAPEAPPAARPPLARPQPRAVPPAPVAVQAPAPVPAAFSVAAPPPEAPAPGPVALAAVPPAPTSAPAAAAPAETLPRFDAAYLNNPKPPYPASSRRRGEEGKVVLRVQVTPDGRSAAIELKASSGHAALDGAARAAVAQWRFVPAQRGDEPVAAWVLVPIIFSLEG